MKINGLQNQIVAAAAELMEQWMSKSGQVRPPFLPDRVAATMGVGVVKEYLAEHDALLLRIGKSLTIKVNNKDDKGKILKQYFSSRQRFSVAHEIGHILLASLLSKDKPLFEQRQIVSGHKLEERLCDMAAAEILMPRQIYAQYVGRLGLSVDSIMPLSEIFRVSKEAAAIRMGEVTGEECLVSYWRLLQPPHFPEKKPFVKWINCRGEFIKSKPTSEPLPFCVTRKSLIYQAFVSNTSCKGFERVELGSCQGDCYLEAKRFTYLEAKGSTEKRYVIAVIFPKRAKPKTFFRKAITDDS